jgi:hypothetical protein
MHSITISTPVRWEYTEHPGGKVAGSCQRLGLKAYGTDYTHFVEEAHQAMALFMEKLYAEGTVHGFCNAHNLTYSIVELSKSVDLIPGTMMVPDRVKP